MVTHFIILFIALTLWCVIHSAMIALPVTQYLERSWKSNYRFYRLIYNIIAFITLVPVLYYAYLLKGDVLFLWTGPLRIIQIILIILALVLFLVGARNYKMNQFLGLSQIFEGNSHKTLSGGGGLVTSGILNVTRHPWYLGAILIIWARDLDVSAVIVNGVFTLYLIVGSYLEERKLIVEFGDEYREYQRRVSMLFPWKWIRSKIFS